ncbi:MAG: LacI family transcriptional regulator [Actinomycetota bacterium]|nr:LacI family transcriptional regulator [Actinomycetota bacterium]
MSTHPVSRRGLADGRAAAPTLDDVARHAGVSRQTVSNVVNGTGRVGERTRDRVLAAIATLGFTPHRGAASLRSGRADRLAYLLPKGEPRKDNTILLEFLQHLVAAADERGQQLLVIQSGGPELRALEELTRSRSIDAVVLSAILEQDARVRHLQALGVPFACFGRTDISAPQCWVDVDNRSGVRHSTRSAIERGHRAIAFIGYESPRRWDADRQAGYSDAMEEAKLRRRVNVVDAADPVSGIIRLLGRANPPTAFVTGSDVLAAACYAAAARAGRVVGRDLAVVGFDGTVAGRLLVPSLATARIPLGPIAERIVGRLLGELPNDVGELLEAELLPGDSLCPAPGAVPGISRSARRTRTAAG